MIRNLILLLFLLTVFINDCRAQCAAGFQSFGLYPNICYTKISQSLPFASAQAQCQSLSPASTLPIFHNFGEYDSYRQFMLWFSSTGFTCADDVWLGIDPTTNSTKWLDGSPVTLSYWFNSITADYCVTQAASGSFWQSTDCTKVVLAFVCQYRTDNNTAQPTTPAPTGNCMNGWYPDSFGNCYLYISTYETWYCAEAYCESLGATLPRFNNDTERVAYYNALSQMFIHCTAYLWLGFWATAVNANHQWINGSYIAANDINWFYASNPNQMGLTMGWWYASSYNAYPLTSTYPYTCQMRPSTNPFIGVTNDPFSTTPYCNVTAPTTIAPTSSYTGYTGTVCPSGWISHYLYPAICYLITTPAYTQQNAINYCQAQVSGATLPIYHTLAEYTSYQQLMVGQIGPGNCAQSVWIGISPADTTKWLDGTNVTFSFWTSHPAGWNYTTHLITGGSWSANYFASFAFGFICQLRLSQYSGTVIPPTTAPPASSCPAGWTVDTYGICYNYYTSSKTWDNAEISCQAMNATLPRFCNNTEIISMNSYLASIFVPCTQPFWVGIKDSVGDGSYAYINGSYVGNNGWVNFHCGAILTRVASYGWQYGTSPFVAYGTGNIWPYVCQIRPAGTDCFTNYVPTAADIYNGTLCPTTTSTTAPSTTTTTGSTTVTTAGSTTSTTTSPTTTITTKPTTTTTSTTITASTISTTTTTLPTLLQSTSTALQSTTTAIQLPLTTLIPPPLVQLGFEPADGVDKLALISKTQDISLFVLQSLDDSTKKQLGYTFNEIVLDSSFNGMPCSTNDFTELYNPQLGNCFAYNYGENPTHFTAHSGSTYGLRLVLDAQQSDYSCTSLSAGFRVVIHENNIMPFPETQGYYIPLGTVNLISIREERLKRLSYPYGKCADANFSNFQNNYSIEACQRLCFQNFSMNTCSCADPRYPLSVKGSYCTVDQKPCLDVAERCESIVTKDCNCPPPCNEVVYYATLTAGKLIANEIETPYCKQLANANSSICNGNYAVVYIYFQETKVLLVTEVSNYGMLNFFQDFSNVIGFINGFGVLSFIEILVLLVLVLLVCFNNLKPKTKV